MADRNSRHRRRKMLASSEHRFLTDQNSLVLASRTRDGSYRFVWLDDARTTFGNRLWMGKR